MRARVVYRVQMDQKTFRDFAVFDAFAFKKHARLPAIFLCIMVVFAVIALASGKPQRGLIAGVLLLVGVGMPAVYVGSFIAQVNKQGKALKLEKPRLVYTVTLADDAITVHNDLNAQEDIRLAWDRLYRVIRRKTCFYLYAVPQKAFILPDADADCGAMEARLFIGAHLPSGKKKKGAS